MKNNSHPALDAGWECFVLGAIAKTTSGGTPDRSKKEYFLGDIPWVKSGELDDDFIFNTEEKITPDGLDKSSAKLFPAGTLLMAMYGATVGRTSILKIDAATNQAVCGISPNSQKVDTDFLRFQLMYMRPHILSQRYGGAQPNISQTVIKNISVFLPSLDEQRRIAYILNIILDAIRHQKKLLSLSRELKSALIERVFRQGTRGKPQKETSYGFIPQNWEIKLFEEFATLQRGKDLTKSEFKEGSVPVAGSNGIIGFHNSAFVEGPGVTVGRSGSVGKVTFYAQDFWAHNTSLYVKDFHNNDPKFTAYYLESLNLGRFKTGASVPTLDRNSFKQIPVAVPPLEEQIEIAEVLTTMDTKIDLCHLHKARLEELFRSLLNRLMEAKIRINDTHLADIT